MFPLKEVMMGVNNPILALATNCLGEFEQGEQFSGENRLARKDKFKTIMINSNSF